jgi:hypothetical protein
MKGIDMKLEVTESMFIDAFKQSDTRKTQFSYYGLKALFEYLEELEDSTGQTMDFDMIAICCEFTEYDNLKEYNNDYGKECKEIEEIAADTELIKIDDERFIILQY